MAKADFWHFHKVRVRFNETDPQGLAHNSVQLVWFGIGLHEYYRALDFDRYAAGARDKAGLHVVKATVEYKAPIRQDEEVEIATRIATILCGGEVDRNSLVDEEWLLRLEREHFVQLAQQPKTQARIEHMLKTGKPLRN